MTVKQLYVATPVQIALLREVLIPEMCDGYWKEHRPAGHGQQWVDVEILVTTNEQVGPHNFKVPRNYNFVNPEFIELAADKLVEVAKSVDPKMTLKLVKRQLTELSQIVGGRKFDLNVKPTKAYRGHNVVDDTPEVNVFESGRGLGSAKWAGITKEVMNALEDAGITNKIGCTAIELIHGNNIGKIMITGADELVIQGIGGTKVAGTFDPTDSGKLIEYAKLYMLSVNNRKQVTIKTMNASVTELPNGTVIRRAPVTRIVNDKALFAANPFNL